MTSSISDAADCCSRASFSSRVSRATSPSSPAAREARRVVSFGTFWRFSLDDFGRRLLASSPDLGAPLHWLHRRLRDMVARQPSGWKRLLSSTDNRYAANSSSSVFASFRSRVSNPSVNQP